MFQCAWLIEIKLGQESSYRHGRPCNASLNLQSGQEVRWRVKTRRRSDRHIDSVMTNLLVVVNGAAAVTNHQLKGPETKDCR
jgi:hypothetical protein